MKVPSAAMVTLPPPVVPNMPVVAATPPLGRSLLIRFVIRAEPTNGVAGEAVVPPVMTNGVWSRSGRGVGKESFPAGGGREMETACEPVQLIAVLVLVAVTVKLYTPVAVGVPLIAPLVESDRPVG